MIKCPKCKKEISHLINCESGHNTYKFFLDSNPAYETIEFQPNGGVNNYECPACLKVLATSEEDASKILRGEND